MYLTYDEYIAMGGTLDESTYEYYEFQAEALVNWYTFNRLKGSTTYPPELKRLMNYLINMAVKQDEALNLGGTISSTNEGTGAFITQQSNDGVSVSYNGMASGDLFIACQKQAKEAVHLYLNGVMNEMGRYLLYRGLYPGE